MENSRSAARQIAVYWRWTPFNAPPDFFISRAEAQKLCGRKEARLFRHGKALQLSAGGSGSERDSTRLRDASCRMDERIIEANAAGEKNAVAITEAWAPRNLGGH
ncbi:MAG: hypothetical protein ABSD20_14675 [Terriglobales bacterium]|jgi:hypothetical protein